MPALEYSTTSVLDSDEDPLVEKQVDQGFTSPLYCSLIRLNSKEQTQLKKMLKWIL